MFEILPQLAFPTLPVSLLLLFYFYFGKKKVNLENNYKWVMTMVVRWEKEEKEKKCMVFVATQFFTHIFDKFSEKSKIAKK